MCMAGVWFISFIFFLMADGKLPCYGRGSTPMYMLAALTDYELEGVRETWCGSRGVRGDLGGIKMC